MKRKHGSRRIGVINLKVEEGYAAAQGGELIDAQDVVTRMTERKRALLGTTANSHDE